MTGATTHVVAAEYPHSTLNGTQLAVATAVLHYMRPIRSWPGGICMGNLYLPAFTIFSIILQTFLECVRLRTFGRYGLQQIQVDTHYLNIYLWRFVSDEK